jgi:TrmH family RNA methyltransferase
MHDADSMPAITSASNPRIKQLLRLHKRRERDAAGVMLVEGEREIRRALQGGCALRQLYYAPAFFSAQTPHELVDACRRAGAELFACGPDAFARVSRREHPDGLLAVAPRPDRTLDKLVLPPDALVMVADRPQKPGNLGALLRAADAAGAHAVIASDADTDLGNPNVVRASTGTLFTLPVVEATADASLAWLRSAGVRIVAAAPSAATVYTDVDLSGPVALVVGAEDTGLTGLWLDAADTTVRIPMHGGADSLNMAVTAALLLYEARRQRGWERAAGNGAPAAPSA